jgi:TM2 domain-containing membrane protein YozV
METTRPNEDWNKPQPSQQENKKVIAGLFGIFLGGLGIHKFILGYTNEGIIMLAVSILGVTFSCFILPLFAAIGMGIIGLVEGIIYLTKTDQEFYNKYQANKRGWF